MLSRVFLQNTTTPSFANGKGNREPQVCIHLNLRRHRKSFCVYTKYLTFFKNPRAYDNILLSWRSSMHSETSSIRTSFWFSQSALPLQKATFYTIVRVELFSRFEGRNTLVSAKNGLAERHMSTPQPTVGWAYVIVLLQKQTVRLKRTVIWKTSFLVGLE